MNFNFRKGMSRTSWSRTCFALLLMTTLVLPGCKREYFELDRVKDTTWNPAVAIPLIKSTVTVPEVLDRFDDDEIITIDPATGLLALRYFSTVFSFQAEEWLQLPAASLSQGVPITAADIANITATGSTNATGTVNFNYDGPNGENVSQILFKGGNINIDLNSAVNYPAIVNVSIPGLFIGGTTYNSGPIAVPANGSGSANINLQGGLLDLQLLPVPGDFAVTLSITYNAPGNAVPGDLMNIAFNMTGTNNVGGPTFAEMRGDFGQQIIPIPLDSVGLRIFDNDAGGIIQWDSAIVRGTLTNTFGLGLSAALPTFRVVNTETGQNANVTFPAGMLPLSIPSAGPGYSPGINRFELVGNNNGANVNTVLNLNPNRLIYAAGLTANPGTGPFNNFMRDTSKMKMDIDVILPFDGRAMDFLRRDTADVDIFPLDGDIEEIVSVTIRLTMDNGFPADAFAQVYMLDTTGLVLIDSLFSETRRQIFSSPTPNANGIVDQTQKVRTVTDIKIDRAKLEKLESRGFGKVVLLGWVDTFQEGNVRIKIFNDYSMDLWLGMQVEAKVKVEVN
jgi:hypothetical protein